MVRNTLNDFQYLWPHSSLKDKDQWILSSDGNFYERKMPESDEEISGDSRWPAFYPAAICLVTASHKNETVLEREVGATIVNRFPYILALSFCKKALSDRHHPRKLFMDVIEKSGAVAVQFLAPGDSLNKVNYIINNSTDNLCGERLGQSGLSLRRAESCDAPVFDDAYMVYEGKLAKPDTDFEGVKIFTEPWLDVGSHRIYFFEISAIQLRKNIAEGKNQIKWRSLPAWEPDCANRGYVSAAGGAHQREGYQKGFKATYSFPTSGTTLFEFDSIRKGMAIKFLSPLAKDQVEIDNDKARWPCFFPSPLAFVTCSDEQGKPNIMPCGSTMVVSRHPMVIAVCISYAAINVRYRPRATLNLIRKAGRFGCGVPYIDDRVIDAIEYAGNVTFSMDSEKVLHAGFDWTSSNGVPVLTALPINYECRVIDEIRLGTHSMFLGEVKKIQARADVTPDKPIEWFPVPDIHEHI